MARHPPAKPAEPVIEIHGLTRLFDKRIVVDHVDLEVHTGEIFALIGPNGAGKSTLIKMLTTMLPPSSGAASVLGHDIVKDAEGVRRVIGYVPQLLSADGALTARENLMLSARLYAIPRDERKQRIEEALTMVKLGDAADRAAQHFSGGMLRSLEIAQSTLHRPALLIMDEPSVGLDPMARQTVWQHIRELRDRYGTTILLTTHLMEEAGALSDRIGVLHKGRLEEVGTAHELIAKIGPKATLDDVFVSIAGEDAQAGDAGTTSRTRRSAARHG